MKKSKLLSNFLLILLSMCIYSCSSSDDDDNINDNPNLDSSNFLEKFDGFGYFYESDYNDTDFWFFKNNPNGNYLNYVEKSLNEDGTYDYFCIEISPNFTSEGIDSVELVTNNTLSLLIQINYESGSQSTIEFNVDDSGNTLTVTENDGEGSSVNIHSKTTTTFTSLCN